MVHKKGKNHSCRIVPPDILSYLPENVIDAIVIHLPLRDAVRTSILSRKWRYTWCRLQKLTLDQAFWKTTNNLTSPTIRFTDIMNGVQHLVLQFPKDNLYKLPSSFFTCFQIRHLSLHKCLINPPPAFKGFDKLVALELCEVTISSKFLVSLISYSPLLEQLVLQSSISGHIQIKAPKLISFDFTGSLKLISLMDVPLLAQLSLVDIDEGGSCDIAKFLESSPGLEHLHLNCYSVQFLASKIPKQLLSPLNCLKRLYLSDICLDDIDEASCVLRLIRSFPYLQDIEIQLHDSASGYDDVMEEIAGLESREVESFSDVTLNHLRSVKLTGIIGLTPEMEFIQLLLAKSPMLIRMLIEPGVGHNSPETRLKVLAEITKFRRASSKAEVVYKVA
ncbi:PREDICTED: F-box/FBD/LRR-repeat protein At1g13570-like isoform X2 [Nicotiana attenuata]|uniref:F-box/FBD/LRR-repeat protein At1g13570-like isoform X2 n=2 Tax=Nicotiana attenuata TaxID=49451 RepID=UPI0009058C8D|nr:PREDICTED: F-box/FBD/LRR-repeat protein At1g13570-like isoform X2 [Nicotiana attenuata]